MARVRGGIGFGRGVARIAMHESRDIRLARRMPSSVRERASRIPTAPSRAHRPSEAGIMQVTAAARAPVCYIMRGPWYGASVLPFVTTHPTLPNAVAEGGESIVLVVDDEIAIRESLASLLQSVGLRVKVFGSAPELLQSSLPKAPSCLVLDIRLPGISGLDFQVELAKAGIRIPIIFMTGHGDIPMSVQAMKAGAVDFLTKPLRPQEMIHAVSRALAADQKRRANEKTVSDLRLLYESLTPRERDVLALVTAGMMNKLIAEELGVSEITVKVHRSHVMQKMRTRSLADLARIADTLGIRPDKPKRI
jgi:FixJ family two-component response regulator